MSDVTRRAWWSVGLGLVLMGVAAAPAMAAPCNDSTLCECGDEVDGDKTLSSADPITGPPACTGDGLTIVTSGVTLLLGNTTITGTGSGTGILIQAGVTGVTVEGRGIVKKFGTGIGSSSTDGSTIQSLTLLQNTVAGLDVTGNGNTIARVLAQSNKDGIIVTGDTNSVNRNRALLNTGTGITVTGSLNIPVERNSAERNGGDGLVIGGTGAFVDRNQCTSNGGDGLVIEGSAHGVSRNTAKLNLGDGFSVASGGGSAFDRNVTDRNRGFGILDDTTGGGTAGTANTYTKNTCKGDLLGKSDPSGLCL